MDSILSIKDASGKTFSILNDNASITHTTASTNAIPASGIAISNRLPLVTSGPIVINKRKYHCLEPGCNKSFTTSGHLARHNRIHTGEKNFHCLYPGCPSRFSRQDNMMQHYRTHLSQKVRRNLRYQQQQYQRSKKERKMTTVKQQQKETEEAFPQFHRHSYLGREHHLSFQPLMAAIPTVASVVNRSSFPYYRPHSYPHTPSSPSNVANAPVNRRPRRALSTSSTSSCDSSYFSAPVFADRVPSMSPPPALLSPLSEISGCCPSPPHIILLEPAHQPTATSMQHVQQHFSLKKHIMLPPPIPTFHSRATSMNDKSSSLLHLADIVSTFG